MAGNRIPVDHTRGQAHPDLRAQNARHNRSPAPSSRTRSADARSSAACHPGKLSENAPTPKYGNDPDGVTAIAFATGGLPEKMQACALC